jgi:anti-sigma regulatory factor (Ser/Thr protein kinase)
MHTEVDPVNLRVPFQAPSASVVRARLRNWLAEAGFQGDAVDDARIVISELVGNSVRHAHPLPGNDLIVTWCLDEGGALVISVSDGGSVTSPHTVNASMQAVSGRGLSIVEALAEKWWIDEQHGRTTVHVRMSL